MEKRNVFCEYGTDFLNNIYVAFMLQSGRCILYTTL